MRRIAIVSQSTLNGDKFKELVGKIAAINYEVRVYNTICSDTQGRQDASRDLARDVDTMVVIGGTKSANTRHASTPGFLADDVVARLRDWFPEARTVEV